jgi:hypothetical protein
MDFFLWGQLKKKIYEVPPRTIEDLVAKLQAAVTTVDANMLRYVRQNAARRTAVGLEIDGGRWEQPIGTTRRPWFDHLMACAV